MYLFRLVPSAVWKSSSLTNPKAHNPESKYSEYAPTHYRFTLGSGYLGQDKAQ